jgi:DNA-binding beta-propeller fold protein YncE
MSYVRTLFVVPRSLGKENAMKPQWKLGITMAVAGILVSATIAGRAADNAADQMPTQVFVVNTGDGTVSLVDLENMKELKRHEVGPRAYGIAISQDRKTVAVGVEDEECVKFYSLPDFKLKGKTPIGKMHNDHIVLTQDGKHVLVANFYSDDVVGIDIATMKEAFRIEGCSAPHVVKYGPLKKRAYVTCKKVTGIAIIDPASQRLVKFHQINVNPRSLTFSPDESKVYFGSFWVNGFFEMDAESGKVTRLFSLDPPKENTADQEVTYHGVEALTDRIVVAANEGRSCVDAVDVTTGKHLSRMTDVAKPCCVDKIPGQKAGTVKFLISNIGDGTLQLAELAADGTLKSLGKVQVGKAPKRVAYLP